MPSASPDVEEVLQLASSAGEELLGEAPGRWVSRLRAYGPRLEEALDWAAEHDPERGLALAAALWRYWEVAGELQQGSSQLDWLLTLVPAPSAARLQGLTSSALLASFAGEHTQAAARAEEAIPLARALDDEVRLGFLELVAARSAQAVGDARGAAARFTEALERFRDTSHVWGTGAALLGLGEVARSEGDPGRARSLCAEGLALFERLEDGYAISASRVHLALLSLELGAPGAAGGHLGEALRVGEKLENRALLAGALLGLAALRRYEGRPEAAARLLGESCAFLATGTVLEPANRRVQAREEAALRGTLGARYEVEFQRGQLAPQPTDRDALPG